MKKIHVNIQATVIAYTCTRAKNSHVETSKYLIHKYYSFLTIIKIKNFTIS
jgi:hypothetical protein